MQHFQSILIVIGLFAIAGVLIHGYLISRKDKNITSPSIQDVDIFAEKLTSEPADKVLSDVSIMNNEPQTVEENIDFSQALNDENVAVAEFSEKNDDALVNLTESELIEVENDDLLAEEEQPQDLFIFNVVAKDEKHLGGHELLQFFLTSGFRFGEMSIFHRHEHSNGTGPVLFSIANMMAPGVFEPEHMEQFKSEGVSFFLTAPNKHIDIKASFEMMLRAVEQIAAEFDCEVLNAQREPMTEEQFIEYNHRLLHYI